MTLDELKSYCIQIANGSGCLFQPASRNYTYILTAKHLFEGIKKDENGKNKTYCTTDGTEFQIKKYHLENGTWTETNIPFIFNKGTSYFPHPLADAAIIKVDFIPAYDKIYAVRELDHDDTQYSLHGFPTDLETNELINRHRSYDIVKLMGAASNHLQTAQLYNTTLQQHDIQGMSGGGIIRLDGGHINIIGIQSEVKHQQWANGQINFVGIRHFDDIINLKEYENDLSELTPLYMRNFESLRLESFKLEVDNIDENRIHATRTLLRNQALTIINSDITPTGIKELFKNRLLISEKESNHLSAKAIWIAWLEFLTIMNIVKYDSIDSSKLSEIFNSYRLKYSNVDDWTTLIPKDLSTSDYIGLKPDSTVIISSKNKPKTKFVIPKGKLIDIYNVYDKSGFRTDQGIDPFTSFNFIHLDYFKTECILNKLEQYHNLDETNLLSKLKKEYNELFN